MLEIAPHSVGISTTREPSYAPCPTPPRSSVAPPQRILSSGASSGAAPERIFRSGASPVHGLQGRAPHDPLRIPSVTSPNEPHTGRGLPSGANTGSRGSPPPSKGYALPTS